MDANAAALEQIRMLTQADTEPKLSPSELLFLLQQSLRADKEGRAPSDPAWIPTYDIAYAVMTGWELKLASLSATAFDFADTDQKYSRQQQFSNCQKMKQEWAKRVNAGVPLAGSLASDPLNQEQEIDDSQ